MRRRHLTCAGSPTLLLNAGLQTIPLRNPSQCEWRPKYKTEISLQTSETSPTTAISARSPVANDSTPSMAESTRASMFADSAIDMPVSPNLSKQPENLSDDIAPQSLLSDRLEQLTAAVWKAEQGNKIDQSKSSRLEEYLDSFEAHFKGEDAQESASPPSAVEPGAIQGSELGPDQEEQLQEVVAHLADTISSMRLRRQEHKHLHQLSVTRLNSVAQRCLAQEERMGQLYEDVRKLREENEALGRDNDELRTRIKGLEDVATQREVAVGAMTSAVAGLEGWLQDAQYSVRSRSSPDAGRTPKRQVVRGRGRFRGRYKVDDLGDRGAAYDFEGGSEVKDLHDGVRAWLRGFKDVEEEVNSPSRRSELSKEDVRELRVVEDDWGDFEAVT